MSLAVYGAAALCCLGGIVFFLRSEWERRQVKVEYYSFGKNRKGSKSECDEIHGNGLRLAFLSDAHDFYRFPETAEKCLKLIDEAAPDLVLLGGDMFTLTKESHQKPETAEAVKFIKALAAKYKLIYGFGNHESRYREYYPEDYREMMDELEACGVTILRDARVSVGSVTICSAELDSVFYKKLVPLIGEIKEMPEKYLIGKLGLPSAEAFTVLMMHSPLYLKEAAAWGADLVLSGHFHGGTVRLPGGRGLMTPQYQFFNKECSGLHFCGSTAMLVNRGLGTHTFHIRWNDIPEISVIDIEL